jgi:hypothetical protein
MIGSINQIMITSIDVVIQYFQAEHAIAKQNFHHIFYYVYFVNHKEKSIAFVFKDSRHFIKKAGNYGENVQ